MEMGDGVFAGLVGNCRAAAEPAVDADSDARGGMAGAGDNARDRRCLGYLQSKGGRFPGYGDSGRSIRQGIVVVEDTELHPASLRQVGKCGIAVRVGCLGPSI